MHSFTPLDYTTGGQAPNAVQLWGNTVQFRPTKGNNSGKEAFLDIKASLALSINISVLERSKRERERIETLNQTIALSVLPYR